MPEYLAPGVFVEETSFRHSSIEGVGTSVAAIAGPTRTGPVRGTPEVCTSFADFTRIYGDARDLALSGADGKSITVLNHTAIAAKAFFDNGGKQLFVSRVIGGGNDTDRHGADGSAAFASASDDAGTVTFDARFPGAMGNATLEVRWRDDENLLKSEAVALDAGLEAVVRATGVAKSAIKEIPANDGLAEADFPLTSLTALVNNEGGDLLFKAGAKVEVVTARGKTETLTIAKFGKGLIGAELPASARCTRIVARQPSGGELKGNTPAVLELAEKVDLSEFGVKSWGDLTVLRGTLNKEGTLFTLDRKLNKGVAANIELPLSALATRPGKATALTVQRRFDLEVIQGGEVTHTFANLSLDPASDDGLAKRLPKSPERRLDALTQPIACTVKADAKGDDVYAALHGLFDTEELNLESGALKAPRYLIKLSGGTDGELPLAVDYGGEVDEQKGNTGLAAFEEIEDISIVMTPAAAADADNHQAVVIEVQKHCRRMRYRVGIVDGREGMALSEVQAFRDNFNDSRLALYHPWVVASDPSGQRRTVTVPPAGFIAGVYANTDVNQGVHKAPANEPVIGALKFAQEINRFQQELLNPRGINCLRSFSGRGHLVWGARTLTDDPEWKYVNVRRYFLYLERSIERSTQWVVFKPNGEDLWTNVKSAVDDFLYNEWASGHLLGSTPEQAYFVRCDRSTMTQNDLDNGRLVCEIGVAPLKPAEFVVFRIGQKTADAE